jgi:hypothetical protein
MPPASKFVQQKRVWKPNPGPQTAFFECPADIIMYGGAKGGGKTDALLIFCMRHWDKPGFRSIFFRKTYRDLELHVIPRSKELFSGIGKYDEKNHRWRFRTPDGGESSIYFGYIQYEGDVYSYSGTQFAYVAIDESNFFSENSARTMIGSTRSAVEGVRPKMALGANPIGPGFGWHKQMFVKSVIEGKTIHREPFRIYKDARWPSDGKMVYDPINDWGTTCFIPARVWDNKILLKNDPGYPARLRTQHGKITEALLEGSWEEGMNLAVEFDPVAHTVPWMGKDNLPVVPDYANRWISVDWGGAGRQSTDRASATWLAGDERRIYAYRGHTVKGKNLVPFAHEIIERSMDERGKREEITCVVLSHECFGDKGMGHTQADQFMSVFSKYNIPVIPSGRDPRGRLYLLRECLRTEPLKTMQRGGELDWDYWQEQWRLRGEAATNDYMRLTQGGVGELLPKLLIVQPTADGLYGCPELIRTLPLLTTDIEDPFVLAEGQDDDDFDCYDEKTEVLTNQGWKHFSSLTGNERCAALTDAGEIKYEPILRIVRQNYRGKMYSYDSPTCSFRVTERHRFIGSCQYRHSVKKDHRLDFITPLELKADNWFPVTFGQFRGHEVERIVLPKVALANYGKIRNQADSFNADAFLEFLGFWLVEGCSDRAGYAVHLDQTNRIEYAQRLVEGLRFPYSAKRTSRGSIRWSFFSKQLWSYFRSLGTCSRDKRIPSFVFDLSPRQQGLVLRGMMNGDGSIGKGHTTSHYNTTSRGLADDFQRLALHCGIGCSFKEYTQSGKAPNGKFYRGKFFRLVLKKRDWVTVSKSMVKVEEVDGEPTFCVSVPSRRVYVRRNGKAMWCGNSLTYGLKAYMGPAERPVQELYRERIARLGVIPDNPIGAENALREAQKELQEGSEWKPVQWKTEPHREPRPKR